MIQLTLTLKMTTAQVVETSVAVNNNSPTFTRTIKLNLLLKLEVVAKFYCSAVGRKTRFFSYFQTDNVNFHVYKYVYKTLASRILPIAASTPPAL